MRRRLAQVIEQPRVRGAERLGLPVAELLGEVLADQRVGVDGRVASPSVGGGAQLDQVGALETPEQDVPLVPVHRVDAPP